MEHTAKTLTTLLSFFITNKTARDQGHNTHTNKTQQQAFKHNTLFGHYNIARIKSAVFSTFQTYLYLVLKGVPSPV
jgi:transcription initiation factor TFIID subunit TAF12